MAEANAAIAKAEAANAQADLSSREALIAHLKLEIEKLRRELYGTRSERKARLLEQMELQLEELEAAATEDELAAENAAARTQTVRSFQRKRPVRKPFPDHLPRERVVIAAPDSCPCCGSAKLSKLGEDITETLEVIPRQWKVIQTVREKFSCRDCETITQPPAPFHVTPRGFVGPNLLAMILFEKFGQHQPLNRQSERYRPRRHRSERLDAGRSGRCLRDGPAAAPCADRGAMCWPPNGCMATTPRCRSWPRARRSPGASGPMSATTGPSAVARRRRRSTTPRATGGVSIRRHLRDFTGILQADAYSGFNALYDPARTPGPITPACAGPMPGGSSSSWPISPRMPGAARTLRRSRRLRWRRSSASTRCSTSSATSTALAPKSVCACARNRARRFWPNWKPGCARSAPGCRARPLSPSRSTTCSSAGTALPASSRMAGSA